MSERVVWSAEQYAHLHRIFDEARGFANAERVRFLDDRCGSDSTLREKVERLLAALEDDEVADAFSEGRIAASRDALESLAPERPASESLDAAWLPEQIGGYRIQRRIGMGGMGVVYEALQESPRRRVAIKLLHPQQATPERLKRLRQEAELLGRLQHPGIAQNPRSGDLRPGARSAAVLRDGARGRRGDWAPRRA